MSMIKNRLATMDPATVNHVFDVHYRGRSHHKSDPPRFGAALLHVQQEISRRAAECATSSPFIKKPAGGWAGAGPFPGASAETIVNESFDVANKITCEPHTIAKGRRHNVSLETFSAAWEAGDDARLHGFSAIDNTTGERVDPSTISSATKANLLRGSRTEIIQGAVTQMSGPRPPRVHKDEIELMDRDVFEIGHDESSPTDHALTQEDYEVFPKIEQWEEALAAAKKSKKGIKREAKKRGWKLTNPGDGKSREDWARPDDEVAS